MKKFIQIMKSINNALQYCIVILSLLFLLSSCVDKENYEYSKEYVKELYDKTFPVKNIDPSQDWKTTSIVKFNVTVYEDKLELYKIKVYDDFPLDSEHPANMLAMGEIENEKTLELSFDCPLAKDTIWVVRVDKANRREAMPASVVDRSNPIDITFGIKSESSRSYSTNTGYKIDEIAAPYTQSQINDMLKDALEVESGKALGADYGIISKTNVYKLTKNGDGYNLVFNGTTQNSILIVTTEWSVPNNYLSVNGDNLTIIIANGGKLKSSLTITNKSNICVMPGGSIQGNNLTISDASGRKLNYNGGNIDLNELVINCNNADLYNAGSLKTKIYTASNPETTLTNMGSCEIGSLVNAGNSNIENGCHMIINDDCSLSNLIIADGASLECKSLNKNQWGSMVTKIGKDAKLVCNGTLYPTLKIYGPNNGKCLLKINDVLENTWVSPPSYLISNVKIEVKDFSSAQATFMRIMVNGSSISPFGESNIYIPNNDCAGDGNTPGEGGDTDIYKSPTYTYCYEDYYPVPGDYDFNDIVMDLSYNLTKVNNKIKSVEIPVQLTAVGATYAIGAALQLIGIDKNNIESATVTNADLEVGNLFSDQATETNKNPNYILPLFKDAHHAISGQIINRYMFNTSKGHEGYMDAVPRKMTVKIVFKNVIDYFGLDNMDLFIARSLEGGYYEGQKDKTRIEVHLREFWENRTNDGVNFADNEAIAGNRTWAICVPDFKYPYETIPIYRVNGTSTSSSVECAYPQFKQWASDRNTATNWYLNPAPGATYR